LISSVFLFALSCRIQRFSECERELCVSHSHREANDSRLLINHCESPANQHFVAFCRHYCRSSGFMAPPLGSTFKATGL